MSEIGDSYRHSAAAQRQAAESMLTKARNSAGVLAGTLIEQIVAKQKDESSASIDIARESARSVVDGLLTAAVGYNTANAYDSLGELYDYLEATRQRDSQPIPERRKRILERNDAIRRAAGRMDWDEFDRLVESFGYDNDGSGGDAPGGGGGADAAGAAEGGADPPGPDGGAEEHQPQSSE